MNYLFDTNICSYVINQRKGFESITRRMDGLRYGELVLSSIVLAELQFMVVKSAVPQAKREQLLRFLLQFHIAPFDESATLAYGQVRHQLERRGNAIGPSILSSLPTGRLVDGSVPLPPIIPVKPAAK